MFVEKPNRKFDDNLIWNVLPSVTTKLSKCDKETDPAVEEEVEDVTRNVGELLLNAVRTQSSGTNQMEATRSMNQTDISEEGVVPANTVDNMGVEEEINYDHDAEEAALIAGDQNAGDDINI
eukprot:scaffold257490_cov24-Attheya_sp.AAC.1